MNCTMIFKFFLIVHAVYAAQQLVGLIAVQQSIYT